MLEGLRTLIAAKPAAPAPGPAGGRVALRDVLRRNWDELWYQPKIDLRSKRLVGAEGLVRARRPDDSIIPPALFLPGATEEEMLALTELAAKPPSTWQGPHAPGGRRIAGGPGRPMQARRPGPRPPK